MKLRTIHASKWHDEEEDHEEDQDVVPDSTLSFIAT